jgi:hypothetical protein
MKPDYGFSKMKSRKNPYASKLEKPVSLSIARAERVSGVIPAAQTVGSTVKTYAAIACRLVRISGFAHSGWAAADLTDPHSFELDFRFSIVDDGNANYLLTYSSLDGRYAADTWHETLEEAFLVAHEVFGIQPNEWSPSGAS